MALAFRASAAAASRPSPLATAKPNSRPQPRPTSRPPMPFPTPTAPSLLALFSVPSSDARALSLPKEDIVSSLTKVEETIGQVEDVGSRVLEFLLSVFKAAADAVKPGVDAALPVLRNASEEALKIVTPVVSDASKQAKEALQSAGVDPAPVLSAAKNVADVAQQTTKVIEGAKPIASATVETVASLEPSVIVLSAGVLFLGYLLLPPIWSTVSFNLRGYKGDLSPPQSLDLISAQNYLLIDIRPEKDKNKTGVPQLPSSDKNKMISLPLEELPSKIKGLVRNAKKVEAEIAALKISYLKKVNKGSNIIIMDSYSDVAKIVARTLTALGFKNSWVMTDGYSGRRGWVQSRLGTDSYSMSVIEVLSPSRIVPPARFGTRSSSAKLLPGSVDG